MNYFNTIEDGQIYPQGQYFTLKELIPYASSLADGNKNIFIPFFTETYYNQGDTITGGSDLIRGGKDVGDDVRHSIARVDLQDWKVWYYCNDGVHDGTGDNTKPRTGSNIFQGYSHDKYLVTANLIYITKSDNIARFYGYSLYPLPGYIYIYIDTVNHEVRMSINRPPSSWISLLSNATRYVIDDPLFNPDLITVKTERSLYNLDGIVSFCELNKYNGIEKYIEYGLSNPVYTEKIYNINIPFTLNLNNFYTSTTLPANLSTNLTGVFYNCSVGREIPDCYMKQGIDADYFDIGGGVALHKILYGIFSSTPRSTSNLHEYAGLIMFINSSHDIVDEGQHRNHNMIALVTN